MRPTIATYVGNTKVPAVDTGITREGLPIYEFPPEALGSHENPQNANDQSVGFLIGLPGEDVSRAGGPHMSGYNTMTKRFSGISVQPSGFEGSSPSLHARNWKDWSVGSRRFVDLMVTHNVDIRGRSPHSLTHEERDQVVLLRIWFVRRQDADVDPPDVDNPPDEPVPVESLGPSTIGIDPKSRTILVVYAPGWTVAAKERND